MKSDGKMMVTESIHSFTLLFILESRVSVGMEIERKFPYTVLQNIYFAKIVCMESHGALSIRQCHIERKTSFSL